MASSVLAEKALEILRVDELQVAGTVFPVRVVESLKFTEKDLLGRLVVVWREQVGELVDLKGRG